jgi:hypothetical protein
MLKTQQMHSKGIDISVNLAAAHIEVSVVIPCLNEANSLGFRIDNSLAALREINQLKMQVALVPQTARANCHEN